MSGMDSHIAASMGPRSFDRGKRHLGAIGMDRRWLQWGRDLSIAESKKVGRGIKKHWKLQWGRDLSIAERPPSPCPHQSTTESLQWGRDLSIAESSMTDRSDRARHSGFNGAAIFRSRKEEVRAGIQLVRPASMGPRSFDRGKVMRVVWNVSDHCGFNGAAIFRSRKGNALRPTVAAAARASMGPRSFDRGKERVGSASRRAPSALQWGRDLSIAERPVSIPTDPMA